MDNEEREKLIQRMKEYSENMTPDQAKKLLIRLGINNEDGSLTEAYRQSDTDEYEYERKFIVKNNLDWFNSLAESMKQKDVLGLFNIYNIEQVYITPTIRLRKITTGDYKFIENTTEYIMEEKDSSSTIFKRYEKELYRGDYLKQLFDEMIKIKPYLKKIRLEYNKQLSDIKNICFDFFDTKVHVDNIEVEFKKDVSSLSVLNIETVIRNISMKCNMNMSIKLEEVTGNKEYYSYYIATNNNRE